MLTLIAIFFAHLQVSFNASISSTTWQMSYRPTSSAAKLFFDAVVPLVQYGIATHQQRGRASREREDFGGHTRPVTVNTTIDGLTVFSWYLLLVRPDDSVAFFNASQASDGRTAVRAHRWTCTSAVSPMTMMVAVLWYGYWCCVTSDAGDKISFGANTLCRCDIFLFFSSQVVFVGILLLKNESRTNSQTELWRHEAAMSSSAL